MVDVPDSPDEEPGTLADHLFRLSREAAGLMEQATLALAKTDDVLAAVVVAGGGRFAEARTAAEEHAYAILAGNPAGAELRGVVAAVRGLDELGRMGRLAVHVAEAVQRRYPRPVVPPVLLPRFAEMSRIAVSLAVLAGHVARTGDGVLARALSTVDKDLDDLHRSLFTVLGYRDWPDGVAVDTVLLSRSYERFADHAVSLARRTASAVCGDSSADAA